MKLNFILLVVIHKYTAKFGISILSMHVHDVNGVKHLKGNTLYAHSIQSQENTEHLRYMCSLEFGTIGLDYIVVI